MLVRLLIFGLFLLISIGSVVADVDFLTDEENQWLKSHPELKLGVDPAWSPFEFMDEKQHYQGMAADYIELLSQKLNIKMKPVANLSWSDVISQAKSKKLDVLPSVVKTDERSQYLNFTQNYLDFPMVIMTQNDAPVIHGIENLKNHEVGVVDGYATIDLIKRSYPSYQLKHYSILDEALTALSVGKIRYVVDNLASISEVIKRKGIINIKVAASTPFSFKLGMAVRDDWPELVSILSKALNQISEEEKNRIQDKWIKIKFDHGVDSKTLIFYSSIVGILSFFIFVVIFYQQKLLKAELKISENELIINSVNRTLDSEIGDDYYKTLTKEVAEALKADIVFVGVYKDKSQSAVQTKMIYGGGQYHDNFSYELEHTPCSIAIEGGQHITATQVIRCFPKDDLLREMKIDGYAGVRLEDSQSQPLGVLVALTHQKIVDVAYYEQLLHVFGVRTSTELERNNTEFKLRKLSNVVEFSPNAVMLMGFDGIVEYVNPCFELLTGYAAVDLIGTQCHLFKEKENYAHVFTQLDKGLPWKGELEYKRKDNVLYWVNEQIVPLKGEDGEQHYVLMQQDVTESHDFNKTIAYQATHDGLTGLINRFEFDRYLVEMVDDIKDAVHVLSFLDLDQFKLINDTCGHDAGDEMLRQLGRLLSTEIRRGDILARLGGDEFGILMPDCDVDQAIEKLDVIREKVASHRFVWQEKEFTVGVSIGVTQLRQGSNSAIDYLKQADLACYSAKDAGRNRIHIFRSEDHAMSEKSDEMLWATRLNSAIENNQFRLYAQMIQPTATDDETVNYEILLRLKDDDGSILSPGVFLGAAERYNLITKIDRWVLDASFAWIEKHLSDLQQVKHFSINLSGQTLSDAELLIYILELVDKTTIPHGKVQFEITETSAIASIEKANGFVLAVKELGIGVSLDDFGSGLSSFEYLKNLAVDTLKIDGVFVKDILDDPIDEAMVKSINEIGHVMGLSTVAEFVENEAIAVKLFEMGIDYVQGYGIGMPMPIDDILN